MKKSAKLKRKTIKLIVKNLIVFTVLVAVVVVGVRSWFGTQNSATARRIQVSCSVPEGLEVAVVAPGASIVNSGSNATVWHDREFTIEAETYTFLSTLRIADVTGNGLSFIKPPTKQDSAVAHVNTSATWNATQYATTANKEYLSLDVYFRSSKSSQKVQLASDTYYGPPDPQQSYGNAVSGWHANSVVGAARMAVFDTSNTQKLLWIPAPHLYFDGINLNTNVTDTSNTYGLYYKNELGTTINVHQDGTYNHGYYTSDKQRHVINYSASSPTTGVTANTQKDYLLHKNVDIATLSSTNNYGTSTTYNTNHVRINMWIEGEDPESRAAQIGGMFKAILKFGMATQ